MRDRPAARTRCHKTAAKTNRAATASAIDSSSGRLSRALGDRQKRARRPASKVGSQRTVTEFLVARAVCVVMDHPPDLNIGPNTGAGTAMMACLRMNVTQKIAIQLVTQLLRSGDGGQTDKIGEDLRYLPLIAYVGWRRDGNDLPLPHAKSCSSGESGGHLGTDCIGVRRITCGVSIALR